MIEKLKYSSLSDSMFNILRLMRLIVIHLKMQMAFKINDNQALLRDFLERMLTANYQNASVVFYLYW